MEAKSAPSTKALPIHVLAACYFGMIFDGLDASIAGLTLHPCLAELLKTNVDSEIGVFGSLVMAMFMFGWTAGAVTFGVMADRIGRARTLTVTVLLYAVFTGLCSLSHNWVELAACRFLVGMGIGGEISIGGVMVAEAWKGNARLHATGFLQSGFSLGFLLLGAINLVIGSYGWRWLYVVGIVPAVLALYIRLKLKDSEDAEGVRKYRHELERARANRTAGGVAAENLGKTIKPGDNVDASRSNDRSGDSVDASNSQDRSGDPGLLCSDSEHETRLLKLPIVELFMPDNRGRVLVLVMLASTVCVGSFSVLAWLPAWINQLCGHLAVNERSYATVLENVGSILGALSGGVVVLRLGRKGAFRFAFLGALVCTLVMFLTIKAFAAPLLVWTTLAGFFVLAPYTYLFIYVPELFDTRLRATAFGFSIQCGRIFAGLANILGGQLVALFGGSFAMAAAVLSLVYIPGLIATFFMPQSSGLVKTEM